jgi:hypothetical protein
LLSPQNAQQLSELKRDLKRSRRERPSDRDQIQKLLDEDPGDWQIVAERNGVLTVRLESASGAKRYAHGSTPAEIGRDLRYHARQREHAAQRQAARAERLSQRRAGVPIPTTIDVAEEIAAP